MKIETKLSIKNMRKNKKRSLFTTVSIMLCTFLMLTTMMVTLSIVSGINENIDTKYKDYHMKIRQISVSEFNKIKDKSYIDKIYIQKNEEDKLHEIEKADIFYNSEDMINVYFKYKNIKKTCNYSNNIIQALGASYQELSGKVEFNNELLTVHGLIDVCLHQKNFEPVISAKVNLSHIIDLIILITLVIFSCMFIIILYNAFLITINERKKEYATINSVGGTDGQILKMIFTEAIIMGIFGILIGGLLSVLGSNIILRILNNILTATGYTFRLIIDIKYIALALFFMILNIYLSVLIPSVKASTISVIQGIKSNKDIKRKRNSIFEKLLPIEGKIALKNLKRNKNKYRIITILLVICITSYISVSTYISYEKETANLINEYDVDAEIRTTSEDSNYKSILDNYVDETGDKIEYMEYTEKSLRAIVQPENALITDNNVRLLEDGSKDVVVKLIGLDDKTYTQYMNSLKADVGDYIIYNTMVISNFQENNEIKYTYEKLFNTDNINLSLIDEIYNEEEDTTSYKIIDDKSLNGKFILTDKLIKGFRELKVWQGNVGEAIIFTNMENYKKIEKAINEYSYQNPEILYKYSQTDIVTRIKVNCGNIIGFSNYIERIKEENNLEDIFGEYYSLYYQGKITYTKILQLILNIIILVVIVIGTTSAINVINASLCEREQEFKILNSLGATRWNINKILIFECVHMFIKATIISVILSIPIIHEIIKHTENIITLNKTLIPFTNIGLFFVVLFILSLCITIYSTRFIKNVGEKE